MTTPAIATTGATYDASHAPRSSSAPTRITSIDFVRGFVMILMAIDHVRVYSGVPAGGPTPGVFFTRWITHFVAPGFCFLAGTAAYLHGRKLGDRNALAKFLVTRGLWLVLLELTLIRVMWTFNVDFAHYMLAGVIWMLGWSMVTLAAAIYLPTVAIGVIGVVLVVLQGAFGMLGGGENAPWYAKVLYAGGALDLGGAPLLILYVLVPWIGVMMAGYAFGRVMEMEPERRRRITLWTGLTLTALFVVLRYLDVGDPNRWHGSRAPAPIAFLATSKYPASPDFLFMTLGPLLVLLSVADGWRGRIANIVSTFGRVPMFYYLLHIPLIHIAACLVSLVREGRVNPWLFGNHPLNPGPAPEGYRWSLALLYLVWALCVAALYFPSAWYARVRGRSKWLSYL